MIKGTQYFLLLCTTLVLISCDYFKSHEETPEAIARVHEKYLYPEDVAYLFAEGISVNDSMALLSNYTNRWASQHLLYEAALKNISSIKQDEIEELIQQYRMDLYAKTYLEELVKSKVDTVVTLDHLKEFYAANKSQFKSTSGLAKLRYIAIDKEHPQIENIRSKFVNIRQSDKQFWEERKLQLKEHSLNDSIWIEFNQIYDKIPFITPENVDENMVAGKLITHQDELYMYWVKIESVIRRNEIEPFEYAASKLKTLIINRRKFELLKKIEQEISEDAIKNKQYEIFK